ncbi:non-homologous end joining protein Ku [Actinophytocola xanthii]|uniref:Non-homologous end joining protein Ku n=1 Tax=Actinophytocola xanthii TaxID=1912961 RepID=A0A1Q8CC39_9PSEU|nr:Ku protein [Actinophytocola xanthii]OLF11934.1 Ku protein [Actinophytocola xanthii]
MRSVWNGTIRIGAASIPVRAYGATEEQATGLHQLHLADGGRIRHRKVCEVDGRTVDGAEVARGYVMPSGETVVLTDEDIAKLPLSTSKSIEVQAFAPLSEIDPIYFARSYHLEPEPVGTKPYVLFSEALQQSGRVAVVKVALRQRESLGVLRIRDQVIVLETMLWPDEIRSPEFPFLHQDVEIAETELAEAVGLIDALSEKFTPSRYTDRYREALQALVQAKIEGNEVVQPTAAKQEAGAADLLTALRTSLAEKADRESGGAVAKAQAAEVEAARARTEAERAASRTRTPSGR